MEIIAVVVLATSVLVGFSTSDRRSKTKMNESQNNDPDWAFTQSHDFERSRGEG